MVPAPFRVARRRQETHDTWTLELEPRDGGRPRSRRASSRCSTRSARARCRSRSAAIRRRGRSCTPCAPSAPRRAAICAARAGRVRRRARPVRQRAGRSPRPRARDVVIVAGGIGLAPLRPVVYHVLAQRERYGRVVVLYGGRAPDAAALHATSSRRWRGALDSTSTSRSTPPPRDWRGRVGVVHDADRRAPRSIPPTRSRSSAGPEVMMRFAVAALRDRGVARRPDLRLDGAQHEVRRSASAGTASSARRSSAATARCSAADAVEPLLEVREL